MGGLACIDSGDAVLGGAAERLRKGSGREGLERRAANGRERVRAFWRIAALRKMAAKLPLEVSASGFASVWSTIQLGQGFGDRVATPGLRVFRFHDLCSRFWWRAVAGDVVGDLGVQGSLR